MPQKSKNKGVVTNLPPGNNRFENAVVGRTFGVKSLPDKKGSGVGLAKAKKSYSTGELKRLGALKRRMESNAPTKTSNEGKTVPNVPANQKERFTKVNKLFKTTTNKQRQKEDKSGLTARERIRLSTSNKSDDALSQLRDRLEKTSYRQRLKQSGNPVPPKKKTTPKKETHKQNENEVRGHKSEKEKRQEALERRNQRRKGK